MSERENFLARWSRRKLEIDEKYQAADPVAQPADDRPEKDEEVARGQPDTTPATATDGVGAAEPEFDLLSQLPSIESITATTDIRPFLTPGVPPELTRAALRRAWSIDPNIRDYIGLAENQWDFNSGDLPGFGPLELTEDLRKFVAEIVGGGPAPVAEPAPERAARGDADSTEPVADAVESVPATGPSARPTAATVTALRAPEQTVAERNENIVQHNKENVALPQEESSPSEVKPTQHGHGSALPR
jgi:Protein of unknown function (DUF3306)